MIKKILIRLGLSKRYNYDSEEEMIIKNGQPVGSRMVRTKFDLLTGEKVTTKKIMELSNI